MDWSESDMNRLYDLYKQHFHQLRIDVIRANRSLGSARPESTWMTMLGPTDFKNLISVRSDNVKVIERWIWCIVRGHEHEFPALRVA